MPDVALDADPDTGYQLYFSGQSPKLQPGWGGTSFVAPQLNGVAALLGEDLHGSRLGLLNFALYALAGGDNAPIHPIAYGDNWFYKGSAPYSPAAGLGTMDVANFAEALQHLF